MKTNYLTLLFSLSLLMQACDLFEAHPYDTRVTGATNINQTNSQSIRQALEGKRSFRFAFISDTQRWYDETEEAVQDINQKKDIDFVIHGGDMSDFGITDEFTLQRDIMQNFRMPWVALLGNHDCVGTGKFVYQKIFGTPNFYFQAGNVLFICLHTSVLESNYSEAIPDFSFLENLLENLPEGVERTIVAMHTPPLDLQFNNNLVKYFQYTIQQFPNLLFCINGHRHSYEVTDLCNDGVLYYQTPCIEKRGYILFTINEDGYEHELVNF